MAYTPKKHYTEDELFDAALFDLEADLRCAIRDNLPEYAEECRRQIAVIKSANDKGNER